MYNYLLIVSFDGSNYHGWQIQPNGKTIQGVLEDKLGVIFNQKISILGCSRTDAGVHSKGLLANFSINKRMEESSLLKGLNSLLPDDIAIRECEIVSPDFHPIKNTYKKIYRYRIYNKIIRDPLKRHYAWHISYELDWDKMKDACKVLLGKNDFAAFMATGSQVQSTIRTLYNVWFEKNNDFYDIYFEGDGFLKQMVRNIVGTLVDIGRGKIASPKLKEILSSRDRKNAGVTAPAHGLTLEEIFYQKI